MNLVLRFVENLALALIVGGGIVMASGIRPLVLPVLRRTDSPDLVATVESISIRSWNRYNRFALVSAAIVEAVEAWRVVKESLPLWHVALPVLMLLALLEKLRIDGQLAGRLKQSGTEAVGSTEQNSRHRRVEFLSICVLVIAAVLMGVPH